MKDNDIIQNRNSIETGQLHYAILIKGSKPFSPWVKNSMELHAECNALKSIPKKNRRTNKKLTLLVIRVNKKGELKLSKPCTNCINSMKMACINTVMYSDDQGQIVKQKISNVDHKPSGGSVDKST